MDVFILIRKKKVQVPSIIDGGVLKDIEIIDDIHNVCFKSLKVAQSYVSHMKPEIRNGVFFIKIKVDPTTEIKVVKPQEILDQPEKEVSNDKAAT